MSKILISIKPEYVNKIFSKEKIYEFRKVKAKNSPHKIIIYCTAPISAVVGEAEVLDILVDNPIKLWNKTKSKSGTSKEDFFQYFENRSVGVAYKLTKVKKYERNIPLSEYGITFAPQSFIYL